MPSGLELYPHNEKAYRKLLDMLSGTRRACIIHPTGTGKAFIKTVVKPLVSTTGI